jgi:hypothetical protein
MLTSIVGLGALLIASRAAADAGADLAPAGIPPAPPSVPTPPL